MKIKKLSGIEKVRFKSKILMSQEHLLKEYALNQIYVVYGIENNEIKYLYNTYPPQIGKLTSLTYLLLFTLSDKLDLQRLVNVWHHTSRHHDEKLSICSLTDLGFEKSDF